MLRATLPTLLAATFLALAGCGDDTAAAGSGSSPVVLPNHAEVMADGTLPDDLCAIIPAAENVELLCNDSQFCGDGGVCVQPIGAVQGQCSQVCFPAPPDGLSGLPEGWDSSFEGCGNSCPEGEVCATLLDADGNPRLLDLNVDGRPDVVGGACQSGAIGEQGAFAACGDAGVCGEGLSCLTLPGRDTGTCFPVCDGVCQPFQTYPSRCSFTTASDQVCLIACDPSAAAPCPAGLECVETPQGNFTCLR